MESSHPRFELLASYSREFQAQLRRIQSFTNHTGSIGTSHEGILRRFLQKYVPKSLEVSEGFIIDRNGQSSSQCDIIIWSHLDFSPYYRDENFVIVPADAVNAVIEVKTTLKKATLISAFKQLSPINQIRSDIYTAIFAFESIQLKDLLKYIAYDIDLELAEVVDSIHAMGGWTLQRLASVKPDDPDVRPDLFMAALSGAKRHEGYQGFMPFAITLPPRKEAGLDLATFLGFLFSNFDLSQSSKNSFNTFDLFPGIKLLFIDLIPGEAQLAKEMDYEGFDDKFNEMLDLIGDDLKDDPDQIIAKYEDTFSELKKIKQDGRKYAEAYYKRGLNHTNNGNYDLAFADYERAIQLDPDYADAYCARGNIFYSRGNFDRALADCEKVIELQASHAGAYNLRANIYLDKNEEELALSDLDRAIDFDPHLAAAYYNRGIIYFNRGNYEQANSDFSRAIDYQPNVTRAYYYRGIIYSNSRNFDQAIADFKKALLLDPDYAEVYSNLGTAYLYKGDQDQAFKNYDKAIELKPDHAEAYNGRGTIYYSRNELDLAMADFNQSLQFAPDCDQAYYNRGMIHYNRGNISEAIADFKMALDLNKDEQLRIRIEDLLKAVGIDLSI